MGFFEDIYGSWDDIQKDKYRAVSSILAGFSGLVLDAGSGKFCHPLPGKVIRTDVIGGDVISDASRLPFRDSVFDAVVSIDAAHLFGTSDLLRVLKNGGILVIALPENIWKRFEEPEARRIAEYSLDTREREIIIVYRKG